MNTLGPVLSTGEPDPIDNPHFAPLLSGVVLTCALLRQNAMLFVGEIWSDMEHSLSIFCDGRCDGLILLGNYSDSELIPALLGKRVPFVLIDNHADDPRASYVDVDDIDMGRRITEYLLSQGHTRIAYLSTAVTEQYMTLREDGCRKAMMAAGKQLRPDFVLHEAFANGKITPSFVSLMRRPPVERPTALVCINDLHAVMAMQGLQEMGLRVPEDVSVTGFDDLAPAALTTPPLTTMRQPLRALGKRAVEIVMKIKEDPEWVCREVLPTELVVRQSVALKSGH